MNVKIRTIDVRAKEWFDEINGNSYFSGIIVINQGMKTEKYFKNPYKIPYQYGHTNHYIDVANDILNKEKVIKSEEYNNGIGLNEPLWRYCERNSIILRHDIQRGCKKKELFLWKTKK